MSRSFGLRGDGLVPAAPLLTAVAALSYAAAAFAVVLTGGTLPLADPSVPVELAPLNGPPGEVLLYLLPAAAVPGGMLALAVHVRRRPPRLLAGAAAAYAGLYAAAVLLLIVDTRILTMLGYVAFLLVLALTDPAALPGDYGWPIVGHQLVLLAGAALWAMTAAAGLRKSRGGCLRCGRRKGGGWFTATAARSWGRPVTIAAAAIPAVYGATRFAWAAGIPLGISPEVLAMMQETGMVYAGLGLASMALLGTILTLGLLQRWGSAVPRRVPWLGGRRVPVLLAVIPAGLVSVVVVPAGATYLRIFTSGISTGIPFDAVNWATGAPTLLWVLWGPLLAAATLAYYLKRRPGCLRCGRDG